MPTIELISFDLCPYVQRSAIALQELGIEHDIQYIDLTDKPGWFLDISPRGKVPVLRTEHGPLFESTPIAEYLNETVGEGRLLPADPYERARARAWMATASDLLGPAYLLMVATDEAGARKQAAALNKGLGAFEPMLADGPWFFGDTFTLVDCVVAPLMERIVWSQELAPSLDIFEGLPNVKAWAERLMAHPAVQASTVDDIQERFRTYVGGNRGVNNASGPKSWIAG